MKQQATPRSERLHIGIFGCVNSGKSTLLNALTGQKSALVSEHKGTTTDPVYKAMEWAGIGAVVFIDTAGFQDDSALGIAREAKSKEVAQQCDIAIVLFAQDELQETLTWCARFQERKIPLILVVNTMLETYEKCAKTVEQATHLPVYALDVSNGEDVKKLHAPLLAALPNAAKTRSITRDLVGPGDVVMLVMPQDIQAPKGRLILPQVQTIRELLDKKCIVVSCGVDTLAATLQTLQVDPTLIICDSQVFAFVHETKAKSSALTSFSVLFAHYKGDAEAFVKGAQTLDTLGDESRILIAEACTHAPLEEDIGRVKIPRMLRRKYGDKIHIDIRGGLDFPKDLTSYDLIIHCGACMFNRAYVLQRIQDATKQGVPITNYGMCIAHLHHLWNDITL